jgi:hypothetical protein
VDGFASRGDLLFSRARGLARGVALTVSTGQGRSFSVTVAEADAFLKDRRRSAGEGLDVDAALACVRTSALSGPQPGWLLSAASGDFSGVWTVQVVRRACGGAYFAMEVVKSSMRGTPT